MYKNVLYTLIKSAGVYIGVQKTYTVYASQPVSTQQQLAVFDLSGTTYIVTDGTTAGTTPAAGINPKTMWSQTATTPVETQFGLVYGFTSPPTGVTFNTENSDFEFLVASTATPPGPSTLYNILYTAGTDQNMVQVNVPNLLPSFTQVGTFDFYPATALTIETGGYNAFTAAIGPEAVPAQTFAGAFRTPLISTDSSIDSLMTAQGDFSLEFWHSLTPVPVSGYHPFTYQSSTSDPLVYFVDVDFDNGSTIYVRINNTVMQAATTQPVLSSRWRHFALAYTQPYTMVCQGAGYEVVDGTNYDFNNDFSIAMTFAVNDNTTQQTLVYKGTSSSRTTPEVAMSYALGVHNGNVTLTVMNNDGSTSGEVAARPSLRVPTIKLSQPSTRQLRQPAPQPRAARIPTIHPSARKSSPVPTARAAKVRSARCRHRERAQSISPACSKTAAQRRSFRISSRTSRRRHRRRKATRFRSPCGS